MNKELEVLLIPSNKGELLTLEEVDAICDEVARGKPRRYIETFLKIEDEDGRIVPLNFVPNQDYFYNETFGALDNALKTGFWAFLAKDRKARSSTFWGACLFAFMMNIPSFHAVIAGALQEHADVALKMIDVFYNNLPDTEVNGIPVMKPVQTHWDKSFREVGFGPYVLENGKPSVDIRAKSSVTISTSRTPTAQLGGTPSFLWEIERAHFDQTFEPQFMASLLDSLPKRAIRVTDSTPFGTKNGHYRDFQAIKKGDVNAIYLLRLWFQNPINALSLDDSKVLPADRRELERIGTLALTDEEVAVTKLFPDDGVPRVNRILWRRWKMAEATRQQLGDPVMGRAQFLQEHMENDTECWMNLAHPVFDVYMLRRMIDGAKPPLRDLKLREVGLSPMPMPGLQFRAWQLPYSGGRFYGGMDLGKGKTYSDATVLEIFDARSGTFVAEMFGRARIIASVRAGAEIMRRYNVGVFGPEVNGIGEGAIDALREYGYPNIYYRQQEQRITISKIAERDYGWYTGAHNRPFMFSKFQEAIAEGQIDIPIPELVEDIQQWNPDPHSEDHTADRVMAAMIAYGMALEGARFPTVNAKMPIGAVGSQQIHIWTPPSYSPWLGRE